MLVLLGERKKCDRFVKSNAKKYHSAFREPQTQIHITFKKYNHALAHTHMH